MAITLYWTDALPLHYIAERDDGSRWIIACTPATPDVWQNAKPYHGNYDLHPAVPANLAAVYDPDRKRPGRPATRGPLTRLDTNIRADVAAVLDQIAETTNTPKCQLIERAVITTFPEHFDHD